MGAAILVPCALVRHRPANSGSVVGEATPGEELDLHPAPERFDHRVIEAGADRAHRDDQAGGPACPTSSSKRLPAAWVIRAADNFTAGAAHRDRDLASAHTDAALLTSAQVVTLSPLMTRQTLCMRRAELSTVRTS
ncbi:hypothetical protein GCM10009546_42650 [Actinomadura livida]|uniref:Uncharacterized protein n=1 Tax=Actinomadura livida TaxID=79909 RepID=A0ABP3PYS8_9ACTN|nr:hypothetical protein GCM10010208_74550 [Actinomadura livida]